MQISGWNCALFKGKAFWTVWCDDLVYCCIDAISITVLLCRCVASKGNYTESLMEW